MSTNKKAENKDSLNQNPEIRLNNISIFFSAYGNFLNGLFCISQYLLNRKILFNFVTLSILLIILFVTFLFSYSKKISNNRRFWIYTTNCSNKIGPCNPFFLLSGMIFALDPNLIAIIILMLIIQISCYLIEFKKNFPNAGKTLNHRIFNGLKKHLALIVTSLFAMLFGWLWYISPESSRYVDLWLNLSSGFIASSITFSVIDRIFKKQQETNKLPLRQAMYRDIQLFTANLILLWQEMYLHSVDIRTNMTLDDFFKPSAIEKIFCNLDLSCLANVYPPQTWFSHIENTHKTLVDRGQKILTTYSNIAEPEVFQAIHYLINDSTYLGRLSIIMQVYTYDRQNSIPRPTLLGSYLLEPSEQDSSMASQLFHWCNTQYKQLSGTKIDGAKTIFPIPTHLNFESHNTTRATSAVTEEKRNQMSTDFQVWQQTHTNSMK